MGVLAAHLNDAGIAIVNADRILYREPGVALLDSDTLTIGNEAFAAARVKPRQLQNAFWSKLTTEPLSDRRFRHLTSADLVSRQLEQLWKRVGSADDELIAAIPAVMTTDMLALFLGIAAELDIRVIAMVDAAVAATRREYRGAVPVHVDLGLHATLLTRILQSGQAQVDRAEVIDGSGLLALYDAWLRAIAEEFVRQSRFDPLHTAETEQMLQDRLPGWLADSAAGTSVTLEIEYRGIRHGAEVESLDLVAAAAPVYQRIVGQVRALYRADEVPAIQMSDRAARLPGLADMLKARVGGEVFLLEPGATARGALARCRADARQGTAVSLIRQLPWDQAAVEIARAPGPVRAGQPTHLLFGNTAYALNAQPLVLGTQSGDGDRAIELGRDMPGISRRHCALSLENGHCVLRDYSRYGTFLNGHRIDGSAVLQVGDHVRVGTPGFEMRLITTETVDGA